MKELQQGGTLAQWFLNFFPQGPPNSLLMEYAPPPPSSKGLAKGDRGDTIFRVHQGGLWGLDSWGQLGQVGGFTVGHWGTYGNVGGWSWMHRGKVTGG